MFYVTYRPTAWAGHLNYTMRATLIQINFNLILQKFGTTFVIKEPYLHSKDVYRLSNVTKKKLFTRKLCKIDHTHMYIKLHRNMGCWSVVIFERMLWHILGQYIPSYPTNNWLKCSNHPCFWYFGQNSVSLMVCQSRKIPWSELPL